MRDRPWMLWTVALLVAGAAAHKGTRTEAFAAELNSLFANAGFAPWSPPAARAVAGTLIALELAVAVAIVVSRTSRAGLVALLGIVAAGIVLVGLASDWGRRAESQCPCGLPLVAPYIRSGFAVLLLRDACIVTLVALAWSRERGGAAAPAAVAG